MTRLPESAPELEAIPSTATPILLTGYYQASGDTHHRPGKYSITPGTGAAGKPLVLDSSGNAAWPDNGMLGLSRQALAATGSSSSDAAVITDQIVAVTASDGTKGVALPAAATTTGPILIINTVTTATLKVYPVDGGNDNINALAEDAAFTMGAGKSGWFIPTSATQWYVQDLAAVTATTTELNYTDVATIGAGEASKAAVADANGGHAFIGRLTTTDGVSSGTARVIGGRAYSNVAASDNVTAVASNNSHIDFANTYSIPASTLKANSITKIRCMVRVTDASGTDTLETKLYIGGTTLLTSTAFDPDAAGDYTLLEFDLVTRAAPGASVEHVGFGRWTTLDGSTLARAEVILAPTNLATNGALVVKASAKWSSNTANTSARMEILNVEIV